VDQVEWFPVSLGKLQDVTEIDLSENRIMALPSTIGSLRYLTKLDLHSNQLINLPDTFGELSSLIDLDLRANQLKSLPTSFRNLTSLCLSSRLPTRNLVVVSICDSLFYFLRKKGTQSVILFFYKEKMQARETFGGVSLEEIRLTTA